MPLAGFWPDFVRVLTLQLVRVFLLRPVRVHVLILQFVLSTRTLTRSLTRARTRRTRRTRRTHHVRRTCTSTRTVFMLTKTRIECEPPQNRQTKRGQSPCISCSLTASQSGKASVEPDSLGQGQQQPMRGRRCISHPLQLGQIRRLGHRPSFMPYQPDQHAQHPEPSLP